MRQPTPAHSLALVGVLAVTVGSGNVLPAYAQDDDPVGLSSGHVDVFAPELTDGELQLMIKDDTGSGEAVFRDPPDVILQALPESETQVPDFPDYAFVGEPGDPVWILPQVENDDLLWPGWNTERLDPADFDGGIELAITSFDGPGGLKLYIEGVLGLPDSILVDTDDAEVTDSWPVSIPTHAHANWAFTADGTYTLTVQARGAFADGTEISTGDITYTFVVGDLPDSSDASQLIVTTIDETDGALVISVDPDDRVIALPTLELAADGQSWEAAGELRPVTVTDTRAAALGWAASGQVSDFTTGDASFAGSHLGWTPVVSTQADGQNVRPGDPVPAGFPSGDGLSVSSTLASATPGDGRGTSELGANLELRVPTDTGSGTYHATLTFTAI